MPPGPPFPEELHLRKVCGVVWCYVGSEESGRGDGAADGLAPEPLLHGVQPMPYPALQSAFDGLYPPATSGTGAPTSSTRSRRGVDVHAQFGAAMPTMKSTMHLYPIDGAAHDVASSDTAWSYRDASWAAVFAGVDPDPANADLDPQVERRLLGGAAPVLGRRRLREHDDGRGPGARPASYRDNYDRLDPPMETWGS